MKMRKVMALLFAAAIGISLVGCGSEGGSASDNSSASTSSESQNSSVATSTGGEKSYTIGWSDGNLSNESNAVCTDAATAYAEEIGVDFILLDAQGNGDTQVSQVENLISQGVDCVIIQPYDAAACQTAAEACIDAGIPVFTAKGTIEDNSICTYVGQDDYSAGKFEMEWVAEKLGGTGNIVVLEGPTGISAAIQRNDGIHDVLDENPDINVLYSQPADWYREDAMALMETWLQMGDDIDAVVAHNDEMALGAYDAIVDAGLQDDIIVIGIDGIDAALGSVADGGIDATVYQDVVSIAKKALDVAVEICEGKEIDDVYYIDPVLITPDNIDEYYNK